MSNFSNFATDWLASKPVFYNTKTNKVSYNINDVIDLQNIRFHPEGLSNYLEWGYSVFGQTPLENVKFLLPNQQLLFTKSGNISISAKEDPVSSWDHVPTKASEVIELIKHKVNSWERETEGSIVLPLSGGYDSRFLATLVSDKKQLHCYTFGPTLSQDDSFEVKYAQVVAKRLNLEWSQIKLGDYHSLIDKWYKVYGISTHTHGMYQIDFYQKIRKQDKSKYLLSGVIGDAWSGKVYIKDIKSPYDLSNLGYTHGLHADPESVLNKPHSNELKENYYLEHKSILSSARGQIIESMRMKMLLLSYLIEVPQEYGFDTYGPFLDSEIVCAMLNLPDAERNNRNWQKNYFSKLGLNVEKIHIGKVNRRNNLNQELLNKYPLLPLDASLLKEIISQKYIDWINNNITPNLLNSLATWSLDTRYVGYIANQIRIPNIQMQAYHAYMTIKPLEILLRSRNDI